MIKFPTTISEYTDGKLWRKGIDESIARRILVDLHKLEDQKELNLRKMYLAHYYYQIGDYRLATTLAKGLLLENKYVDDVILLIKKICIQEKDLEGFTRLIKLADKIYRGKPQINLFDEIESFDVTALFNDDKETAKGRVIYNGTTAEYYRGGELVFSVEDKNCEAFFKDSLARHLLLENRAEEAIELLSGVKLSKLKNEIRLCCHQTLVIAYCMLEEYDDAYEYVVLLMENGIYMQEMSDILFHLYKTESEHFEELKQFYLNYDKFNSAQLADVHSLAKDIGDEEFWNTVFANNPISPSDISEETLILKGVLAFNNKDYDLADRTFKQATAIYSHFGKSRLFRYYVESYAAKRSKNHTTHNMPEELYTGSLDDMYTFIDKKLLSKLKKCQSREDFLKNADDNMLEVDNMLSGVYAKISDVADIVNRVYKMNYIPARGLINRVIVNNEYDVCVRSICLANFMMYSNQNKFAFDKDIYDNPFARSLNIQIDGAKEPLAYGIAIYLATAIFQGIDNEDIRKECEFLKTIYSRAKGDYSDVAPFAVFGVLFAYLSDDDVHYVKDAIKKREVKVFAETILDDAALGEGEEKGDIADAIEDFLTLCAKLAGWNTV